MESVICFVVLLSVLCINALPLDIQTEKAALSTLKPNNNENLAPIRPLAAQTNNFTLRVKLINQNQKIAPLTTDASIKLSHPTTAEVQPATVTELKQTETNKTKSAKSDKDGQVAVDSPSSTSDSKDLDSVPDALGPRLSARLLMVLATKNHNREDWR